MKTILSAFVVASCTLIGGCVVVQPRPVGTPTTTSAKEAAPASTCPGPFVGGYRRPDPREYREPPRVYPLFTCEWMQPLIQWAKSASNYEWERGGCTGGTSSFTCQSTRGPSGSSPRRSEKSFRGGQMVLALATASLKGCPTAVIERRTLTVSVDHEGRWSFDAREECYE